MTQCSIKTCKNESFTGCGVSFHKLPIKEALKQKWLDAIGECLRNVRTPIVCSVHFRPEDYDQGKLRLKLKKDAVPSIFAVGADTEHERPLPVKMEIEKDEPPANVPIKQTSGPSPKFLAQMKNQASTIVEVKTESDPIEPGEDPPSEEEEAVSFGENPEPTDDDQTYEDLVPLSAHPVPLSDAPDPLCDVRVKEEENNEAEAEDCTGADDDGTVKEEDRTGGVKSQGGMRQGDGEPSQGVPPPMTDMFQTCKTEQIIKNLTRRSARDRASVRNVLRMLRRRDDKISDLQRQVDALSRFVCDQHGTEVADKLKGSAARTDEVCNKICRLMVKRKDEKISELQSEVESLRLSALATRDQRASQEGRGGDALRTQIYSIKKDERMKEANRQLLIIERDDRHNSSDVQTSVQSTSDSRLKSSAPSTSDIRRKTLVDAKPTCLIADKNPVSLEHTPRKSVKQKAIPKNPLVVMQPILYNPESSSFGIQTTLEDRQKSAIVKPKSVVQQIGNKRKSDIRKNVEKRRIVVHPQLDQQIKSSDIPQTSVGLQRTSGIRQNPLVIQIDGMQSTVIQPKLVRLGDNDMVIS